jgi:hypothetical protein
MRIPPYFSLFPFLALLGGCSLLQAGKLYAPETFGFVSLGPNIYIEQTADDAAKSQLREAMRKAKEAITGTFGDAKATPTVNACVSEHCFWAHGGRGEFAKVYGNRILLSPRGLNWHFIAHEWSHAEMSTRLVFFAWKRMPQWFDEGVAVAVSEAPEHSERHWQYLVASNIAHPTREELYTFKTLDEWLDAVKRYSDNKNSERRARGETEIHSVYAAAGHEIRPWLAEVGTQGLLTFVEKLNAGEAFEAAYQAANPAVHGALRDKTAQRP